MDFEFARVAQEQDVAYLDKMGVDFKSDEDSGGIMSMLWWLFPLVLIVGFWIFILRRMNPSQQVMSFGKSKAKIYAEKEVQVDFSDVAGIEEAVEEVGEIVEFLQLVARQANSGPGAFVCAVREYPSHSPVQGLRARRLCPTGTGIRRIDL